MFGGIVETTGIIKHLFLKNDCQEMLIEPRRTFNDLAIGDSISINGVCLTITQLTNSQFSVTAVPETLRLTNLRNLQEESEVNIERALSSHARIGGHYVQGHVDGTGTILEVHHDNSRSLIMKISIPENLSRYIIRKGFITMDGMSITVIDVTNSWFTVTIIPHTQSTTILKSYRIGTQINIEVDMIAKYIERILGVYQHASNASSY